MLNGNQKELAPRRLDNLRELIRGQGVIRIEEICRLLRVSPATVRRDLNQLERPAAFGASTAARSASKAGWKSRCLTTRLRWPREKNIALPKQRCNSSKRATRFISTAAARCWNLRGCCSDRTNLTVVTNSLRAAHELAGRGPRLILIGGELRRLSQTMVGPLTRFILQELHVDKAFMGTIGLTLKEGLTTTDPSEAYTKELVMSRARQVILLADSGKAGKSLVRTRRWAGKYSRRSSRTNNWTKILRKN